MASTPIIMSKSGGFAAIRRFQPASGSSAKPVVVQVKIDCSVKAEAPGATSSAALQRATATAVAAGTAGSMSVGTAGITVQRRDNCCIISIPRSAVRPVTAPQVGIPSSPASSVIRVATRRLQDSVGGQVRALVAAQEGYAPPPPAPLSASDAVQAALTLLPAGTRKRYQCKLCRHCYARLEYLARHVRLAHLRDSRLVTAASADAEADVANNDIVEVELEEEEASEKDESGSVPQKRRRQRAVVGDANSNQILGPGCTLCDRRFADAEELRRHLSSHPGSYECPRCGRWFPSLPGLRRHAADAHAADESDYDLDEEDENSGGDAGSGEAGGAGQSFARPCICAICQADFPESMHLANHVKSVHRLRKTGARGEERCYQCAYCLKCFHQHTNLRRHLTCHTGQRQFPCPICQRRFADRGDVNKHMVTHTGVRPFKCEVCGRRFGQRTNLRTHALTHAKQPQHQRSSPGATDAAAGGPSPSALFDPSAGGRRVRQKRLLQHQQQEQQHLHKRRVVTTRQRIAAQHHHHHPVVGLLEPVDVPEADEEVILG